PRRQPKVALGTYHVGPGLVEKRMQLRRLERHARAVDEARDAVLLGLGHVVFEAAELLEPRWVPTGGLQTEEPGIQDGAERHVRIDGLDDARIGVERADDGARCLE